MEPSLLSRESRASLKASRRHLRKANRLTASLPVVLSNDRWDALAYLRAYSPGDTFPAWICAFIAHIHKAGLNDSQLEAVVRVLNLIPLEHHADISMVLAKLLGPRYIYVSDRCPSSLAQDSSKRSLG